MIKRTPPMGWNTWNTFAHDINEELLKKTADKIVESGLKDAGYEYVIIDDCWSLRERDENGKLVADPKKFPSGMKALGDYLHSKGLKFGIYSCIGTQTCERFPGSFDYEFVDAQTFAEWGVDYLKFDFCYKPASVSGQMCYRRMSTALANCGRDILFNTCSWGQEETHTWINTIHAHAWRSTEDIFDNWKSIETLFLKQYNLLGYGGMNCFNDMDMLVVGMKGVGRVGLGGMSKEEYSAHFDIWAFMASNLIIGCDVNKVDKEYIDLLCNKEIIAINQDEAVRQPFIIHDNTEGQKILGRNLANGDIAFLFVNLNENEAINFSFNLDAIGLNRITGKTLLVKELHTGKEWKITNSVFDVSPFKMPKHTTLLFRAKVVDL